MSGIVMPAIRPDRPDPRCRPRSARVSVADLTGRGLDAADPAAVDDEPGHRGVAVEAGPAGFGYRQRAWPLPERP